MTPNETVRQMEVWGLTPSQNKQLLPTYANDDLWSTRWQHRAAMTLFTKLLWTICWLWWSWPPAVVPMDRGAYVRR